MRGSFRVHQHMMVIVKNTCKETRLAWDLHQILYMDTWTSRSFYSSIWAMCTYAIMYTYGVCWTFFLCGCQKALVRQPTTKTRMDMLCFRVVLWMIRALLKTVGMHDAYQYVAAQLAGHLNYRLPHISRYTDKRLTSWSMILDIVSRIKQILSRNHYFHKALLLMKVMIRHHNLTSCTNRC